MGSHNHAPSKIHSSRTITGAIGQAIVTLNAAGWSDPRISEALGFSKRTICVWRRRNSVAAAKGIGGAPADARYDLEERMALYRTGCTDGRIARLQGCTQSAVTRWRHAKGLSRNADPNPTISDDDRRRARKLLLARMAVHDVAAALKLGKGAVARVRADIGLDSRLLPFGARSAAAVWRGFRDGERRYSKLLAARRPIAFRAYADGLIDRQIAEKVGCARGSIWQWRMAYGLPPNYIATPRTSPSTLPPPISPLSDDLYRLCDAAVSRLLAPHDRQEAISDLICAHLEGRLALDDIGTEARKFENRVIGQYSSRFGDRSLDEEIGEDGFTLGHTLVDEEAEEDFRLIELKALAERMGIDVDAVLAD